MGEKKNLDAMAPRPMEWKQDSTGSSTIGWYGYHLSQVVFPVHQCRVRFSQCTNDLKLAPRWCQQVRCKPYCFQDMKLLNQVRLLLHVLMDLLELPVWDSSLGAKRTDASANMCFYFEFLPSLVALITRVCSSIGSNKWSVSVCSNGHLSSWRHFNLWSFSMSVRHFDG